MLNEGIRQGGAKGWKGTKLLASSLEKFNY